MNKLLVCWQSAWVCWGLACWVLLMPGTAQADHRFIDMAEGHASSVRIKAAYLYRFGAFVQWPDDMFSTADAPLVIGVLGADALADELATLIGGRSLQGRPIAVRRLRDGDIPPGVHMLFIGQRATGREAELLASARGLHVLTVTDDASPEVPRGMINFVTDDGRVRFDVCLKAAQDANLGISARLLAVARRVRPDAP